MKNLQNENSNRDFSQIAIEVKNVKKKFKSYQDKANSLLKRALMLL